MRTQTVLTAPSRLKIGSYLTAKGQMLLKQPNLTAKQKKAIKAKYTKNRYKANPDSKPFRGNPNLANKGKAKQRQIEHVV